jgi:phage/plasmid-like protein (TIGR03299 family)
MPRQRTMARHWRHHGTTIDGTQDTIAGVLEVSSLDYTVATEPAYLADGRVMQDTYAIVRDDGRYLGSVGRAWRPIQHRDAFAALDPLIRDGKMEVVQAGVVGDGQVGWILAESPGAIRVGRTDDEVGKYLLLSNHHGGGVLQGVMTPNRLWCGNQLRAALAKGRATGFKIRHVGDTEAKMEEALRILGIANAYYDDLPGYLDAFAGRRMTALALASYFAAIYPDPLDPAQERAKTTAESTRTELTRLFDSGIKHDMPGVRGTLWAALNAVTEFIDHRRGGNARAVDDVRSVFWGHGADIKALAWTEAKTIVGMN